MLILTPAQLEVSEKFQAILERRYYDIWLTTTLGKIIYRYDAIDNEIDDALKGFKHLLKSLNKPHGIFYYDSYIYCWLFVEKKPSHDRCHLHALIQRINPARSKDLQAECKERFGESFVEPYNPNLSYRATQYISDKYAVGWIKSYDFCKINSRYRWNKKSYSTLTGSGNPTPIQVNLSEREKWNMIRAARLLEQTEQGVELGA